MRIVIATMKHETNTFSPIITDWQRFQSCHLFEGDNVIPAVENTRMASSAYLKLARQIPNAKIITPIVAEAMPSGLVTKECFDALCAPILDAVRKGCDMALLDLHGAMVCTHTEDGEGTLLEAIRQISPNLPIAVTLDLHCNLTQKMVDNCTALMGYKTYPHTDIYETAEQVGQIVIDHVIHGKSLPVMCWGQSPLLSQTLRQGSDDKPMKGLIEKCRLSENCDGILGASVFGGFALADIKDAGTSVIIVVDPDAVTQAEEIRDELLNDIWAARDDFLHVHSPIDLALNRAEKFDKAPIILLDHADNCGSGATQDVMMVIEKVIQHNLENVAVATVWDPIAVQQIINTGVGNILTLDLGGRTPMPSVGLTGKPLQVTGRIENITDGDFIVEGPMYTGVTAHMGPTAVINVGRDIRIVITSLHHEPWDTGVFTSVGINPESCHYLLLKSRIHYRAGFRHLENLRLTLDGDGVTTSDNSRLNYKNVRRPIYPLDNFEKPVS